MPRLLLVVVALVGCDVEAEPVDDEAGRADTRCQGDYRCPFVGEFQARGANGESPEFDYANQTVGLWRLNLVYSLSNDLITQGLHAVGLQDADWRVTVWRPDRPGERGRMACGTFKMGHRYDDYWSGRLTLTIDSSGSCGDESGAEGDWSPGTVHLYDYETLWTAGKISGLALRPGGASGVRAARLELFWPQ